MKMRDWESTLIQAWKNNVGVVDAISNLGGMCSVPLCSWSKAWHSALLHDCLISHVVTNGDWLTMNVWTTGRVRDFTEETSTSYWLGAARAPLGPHSLADAAAKAAPAVVNVTLQGGSQGLFNVRTLECMYLIFLGHTAHRVWPLIALPHGDCHSVWELISVSESRCARDKHPSFNSLGACAKGH